MADVSMNLKEFNVEFDDTNTSKSANIVSGHDIKESFAIIHKRLNNIGYTLGTENTIINSNVDLDDYYNYGIYQCNNTSLTITHAPITGMFKLYVINVAEGQGGASRIAQYFLPANENCIYVRYQDNTWDPGVWNDWKRLGEQVILSYGNSTWDDFYDAYIHNAVVYCRASSNSNPATGTQTRMAFLAYVNNGTDPTEGEFQYYRSINSHTDSTQGDEVYVYKLNKTTGWSVTTRKAYTKVIAGSGLTSSFTTGNNSSITLNHTDTVTAGTYDTVTVNGTGHVTAGSSSRVSNVAYNTTNDPILTETIGSTTTTIETPDTVPTLSSKHLVTSNAVAEPVEYFANTGHKNLLKNLKESTRLASNSVYVTLNEDGTYTLSGTASAETSLVGTGLFSDIPSSYVGRKLRLTGGVSSSVQMRIYPSTSSGTAVYSDSGSGVEFVLTQEMLTTPYDIRIFIANGTVCDGIVVRPMLRLASIPDDTFKQYALTDPEIRAAIGTVANAGAKNLLKYRRASTETGGVTFVTNSDGSISLSGTCTSADGIGLKGVCLLSDLPQSVVGKTVRLTGGANQVVRLRVYANSTSTTALYSDYGCGVNFVVTSEMISTPAEIRISIVSGTNCNGITIYPMLRLADIPGDQYEPYAQTNVELTNDNNANSKAVTDLYYMYYDMNEYDIDIVKLMRLNTGGTWSSIVEGYQYVFNGTTYRIDTTYPAISASNLKANSYLILSDTIYCTTPYRLQGGCSTMYLQFGDYISNGDDSTGVVIPANYNAQLKITFPANYNDVAEVVPMLFPDSYTPYSFNYPWASGMMFAPTGVYSNYKLSQIARYTNQLSIGQVVNWATSSQHLDLDNFTAAGVYSFPHEFINYIDNKPVANLPFKLEVSNFYVSDSIGFRQICDYGNTRWVRLGFLSNSQPQWSAWVLECMLDGTDSYANITNNSTIKMGSNYYTPVAFATCDSAANAQKKVASIVNNTTWTRTIGSIVAVKFANTNTYSATTSDHITLNINGTGDEDIYYNASNNSTGTNTNCYGVANKYAFYIWDGTYWVWLSQGSDNNTTYTPQSLGFGYGTCTTAEATAAKVATLSGYALTVNGMPVIKFTYAVPANATLNINSKGAKPIYYRGSAITAGIIKAGDTVTFVYSGGYYHVTSII